MFLVVSGYSFLGLHVYAIRIVSLYYLSC